MIGPAPTPGALSRRQFRGPSVNDPMPFARGHDWPESDAETATPVPANCSQCGAPRMAADPDDLDGQGDFDGELPPPPSRAGAVAGPWRRDNALGEFEIVREL